MTIWRKTAQDENPALFTTAEKVLLTLEKVDFCFERSPIAIGIGSNATNFDWIRLWKGDFAFQLSRRFRVFDDSHFLFRWGWGRGGFTGFLRPCCCQKTGRFLDFVHCHPWRTGRFVVLTICRVRHVWHSMQSNKKKGCQEHHVYSFREFYLIYMHSFQDNIGNIRYGSI